MMLKILALSLLAVTGARKVHDHLLIDDPSSALIEIRALNQSDPSVAHQKLLVEVLVKNGLEEEALNVLDEFILQHGFDRNLLEELSWGILKKGLKSSQYGVRIAALIGSFLTKDARAVPVILKMMRDSHAVIRSAAIQMAKAYQDGPLKQEIARMMREEKVWLVRLEIIQAIGKLRMKELAPELKALVQSNKTTLEERSFAIESLVAMYDHISFPEWQILATSNRAGLRHLACSLASHFHIENSLDILLTLTSDSHPQVRVSALNALGLMHKSLITNELAKKIAVERLDDLHPVVSITACWFAHFFDPALAFEKLSHWLKDSLPDNRRLAAACLAATGSRGVALAEKVLRESDDPYVKANVALGLLGQRAKISECCDFLISFLQNEKRLWMVDASQNPLFSVLNVSHARYNDQIPNYPEALDQMTRLKLFSLLALVEEPRALDALKNFLQTKTWGISGVAAITLLQEGDESALELLRQLMRDKEPNVRLQACLVLAMMGKDPESIRELQGAYATADHEKKLHILEALCQVGNEESYAFLIKVLREPFSILKVAAASALIQSLNR